MLPTNALGLVIGKLFPYRSQGRECLLPTEKGREYQSHDAMIDITMHHPRLILLKLLFAFDLGYPVPFVNFSLLNSQRSYRGEE